MQEIPMWKIIGLCVFAVLSISILGMIQICRKFRKNRLVIINVSSKEFLSGSVLSRRR